MKFVNIVSVLLFAQFATAGEPNVSPAQPSNTIIEVAIELLEKLEESGYDNRFLCIFEASEVVGRIPQTHWSRQDQKIAFGTVDNFPAKVEDGELYDLGIETYGEPQPAKEYGPMHTLSSFEAKLNGKSGVCVAESKPVLE